MKVVLKVKNLDEYQDALKRVTLGTAELKEAIKEFNKAVDNLEFETAIDLDNEPGDSDKITTGDGGE